MLTSSEDDLVFFVFFPSLSVTLSPHAAVVYRITHSPPCECVSRRVFLCEISYLWFFVCSATLLAFLVELLKSSVAMQEQMLGGKGFLVIGYLLEKVWWDLYKISLLITNQK